MVLPGFLFGRRHTAWRKRRERQEARSKKQKARDFTPLLEVLFVVPSVFAFCLLFLVEMAGFWELRSLGLTLARRSGLL